MRSISRTVGVLINTVTGMSVEAGDVWTWTATGFMDSVEHRIARRVRLTTDGRRAYLEAADHAMLVKMPKSPERKCSPSAFNGARPRVIEGKPDQDHIPTSCVERRSLTTWLTNAFSKRIGNHIHMLSLYFVRYNFVRVHASLRCTPRWWPV